MTVARARFTPLRCKASNREADYRTAWAFFEAQHSEVH